MNDRPRLARTLPPLALPLALVVGFAFGGGARAQHAVRMEMSDSTRITVTAPSGVPEIPFELINNHVIVPVSIDGFEFDAILDTGMPSPGLALFGGPRADALDLEIDPSIEAHARGAGGDGKALPVRMATDASLELPGVRLDRTRILLLPSFHYGGYHEGVIGYSLFERFVVELDYEASVMRLHDPAGYRPPEGARELPLTLRHNKPFVTVRVRPTPGAESFDAEVVVDLGASHAISLNTDESARIELPEKTVSTVLGRGLSGQVRGELGRVAELGLDGLVLTDVLASFPISQHQDPGGMDSFAGNLGSDVLRRFTTIFDYSGRRLLLVPNASFSEPFRFDRSGVRFDHDRTLRVREVLPGSPASESGIEVGDVLTHLDGTAVSGDDLYDVRAALRGSGEVRVSLDRKGRRLEKTLTLRRLI